MSEQVASSVILIRPTGFGFDPETAASNTFQQRIAEPDVKRRAAEEFDALLEALRIWGVHFTVLDPQDRNAPNGVFPNNWFSTHADGTVVLYPMLTPSRRAGRDPEMEKVLQREGFKPRQTLDFSGWEHRCLILEGTGSLVLDRVHKKAFACLSERTWNAVSWQIWVSNCAKRLRPAPQGSSRRPIKDWNLCCDSRPPVLPPTTAIQPLRGIT